MKHVPPSVYVLDLPFLPASANHRMGWRKGANGLFVKSEPVAKEDRIRGEMKALGFKQSMKAIYELDIIFTFPDWRSDIDGPLKATLDSVVGNRYDHRVTKITVTKLVIKGQTRTQVRVVEYRHTPTVKVS